MIPTLSGRRSAGHTLRAGIAAVLFTALVSLMAIAGAPAPAHAAGRVDVSPTPSTEGETIVTLSGSGFQYLPNAPGGIYVSFGVVADPSTNSWAPSQGGKSGETFGYASTGGTTILVSFAGGSSAEAANALIEADGTWTAQMKIPGSSFPSISGNPHAGEATEGATIDCLQVQCGVITFGAHGMINANNESFTPVSFVTPEGNVASGTAGQTFQDGGVAPADATDDDATSVEVPGAGSGGSGGSAPSAAAPTVAPGEQNSAAPAPVTPTSETASTGLSSSALVMGVLAFAVLVLLAAVIFALVRRSRAAKAAAALAGEASVDPAGDVSAGGTESSGDTLPGDAEESASHTQETQVNAAADAIRHREGAL